MFRKAEVECLEIESWLIMTGPVNHRGKTYPKQSTRRGEQLKLEKVILPRSCPGHEVSKIKPVRMKITELGEDRSFENNYAAFLPSANHRSCMEKFHALIAELI
jgi:hypothetical protein